MRTHRYLIAVATYQRPAGLQNLLGSIAVTFDRLVQRLGDATPHVEVLVIDNDPSASARELVQAESLSYKLPLRYGQEPAPGLGHVRNRSLDEAVDGAFCSVIFVDDDEAVAPDWLLSLHSEHASHPEALLFGPVTSVLESGEPAPIWFNVSAGRIRYADGVLSRDQLSRLGDGNTLMPTAVLQGVRYREQFATSGGQDSDLFHRLTQIGVHARFVNDASAIEIIPMQRGRVGYSIRRARSTAANQARIDVSVAGADQLLWALGALVKAVMRGWARAPRSSGSREHMITWALSVIWCSEYALTVLKRMCVRSR